MSATKNYTEIVKHYENCFLKHGDTHLGVDWPNMPDLEKRYQIMLEVIKPSDTDLTLLDFGCGSAMFLDFLEKNKLLNNLVYSGLDLGKEYITYCRKKYPERTFYHQDILRDESIPNFDYIIANGVFTEKRTLSFDEMFDYFKLLAETLFRRCNQGLALNFMSKAVDWERDDLFHLSADLLIDFVTKKLSRNFVIRNDYGLYEYTLYLYR